MLAIGVDIGGTKIAAGVVDTDGEIIAATTRTTPATDAALIEAARNGLQKQFANFVPAHPIAGKEVAGIEHAEASLFTGRQVVLTPAE